MLACLAPVLGSLLVSSGVREAQVVLVGGGCSLVELRSPEGGGKVDGDQKSGKL